MVSSLLGRRAAVCKEGDKDEEEVEDNAEDKDGAKTDDEADEAAGCKEPESGERITERGGAGSAPPSPPSS